MASAVLTTKGNIYKGICIDTDGSIGMCAEGNALSTMLTYGESEVAKVILVYKDGNILFCHDTAPINMSEILFVWSEKRIAENG